MTSRAVGRTGDSWITQVESRLGKADYISLGSLAGMQSEGSYGFVMIAMAIPGLIPGLSSVAGPILGLALISLGIRYLRGEKPPWLPKRLQALKIDRRSWLPKLICIDRFFNQWGHRMAWIDRPIPPRWIGIGVIWAGLVLGSPLGLVPMSNAAPALSVCLFGIGLVDDTPSFVWIGLALLLLYTLIATTILIVYWHILIEPGLEWIRRAL